MDEQVKREEILDFTRDRAGIAVAECIAELGCVVFSEGTELPIWASYAVAEELPGCAIRDRATLKSGAHFDYWVLNWDGLRSFAPIAGPMTTAEFHEYLRGAQEESKLS